MIEKITHPVINLLALCFTVYGSASNQGPTASYRLPMIVNNGLPAMRYPSNTYDRSKLAKIPNSQLFFDLDMVRFILNLID